MANNKWMSKLQKLEGAVIERRNIHKNVIQPASPYLGFIFGHGHGLPFGHSMMLWGEPKSGKSLIANLMAGALHSADPDAIVMKFNTELREGQLDEALAKKCGICLDRYVGYDVNSPDLIFDTIEKQVNALCQEGMPLKLIILDSLNSVQGRRGMNSESILTQQMGDRALTIKEGMLRILPVLRKHNIALITTSHSTPQLDVWEARKSGPMKPSAGVGTLHTQEYIVFVQKDTTKAGRTDIDGKEFVDESVSDGAEKGDSTGHKIRFCMKESSFGSSGRHGFFTWDFNRGIINTHEEIWQLGLGRNIIEKVSNVTYAFGGVKWTGKDNAIRAIKEDPKIQEAILKELRRRDLAGEYRNLDMEDATSINNHEPE